MKQDSPQSLEKKEAFPLIFFKGILMGAVEIIPGVSAGTLALITGILPRLLNALRNFNLTLFRILFKDGLKAAWQHIDGTFLVVLALGIFSGFVLLLQFITFALSNYPIFIWSFFFGLILASSAWLALQNCHWKKTDVIFFFLSGFVFALFITLASPVNISLNLFNVFVAGMLAISAMMLPGLSGSFMLMLAGLYEPILNSLKAFQLDIILSFMAGASIGILAFSHVLSFLFGRFPFQVYALLTGVMLGSLNRIWPWQLVTQYRVNSHGEEAPMLSKSITPWHYSEVYGQESHMLWAIGFMTIGMLLVLIMSKLDGLLNSELKS